MKNFSVPVFVYVIWSNGEKAPPPWVNIKNRYTTKGIWDSIHYRFMWCMAYIVPCDVQDICMKITRLESLVNLENFKWRQIHYLPHLILTFVRESQGGGMNLLPVMGAKIKKYSLNEFNTPWLWNEYSLFTKWILLVYEMKTPRL